MEKECVISVGSLTSAHRSRNLLGAGGVRASIIRPSNGGRAGCEYGLSFDCGRLLDAARILKEAGIPYRLLPG